MGQRGELGIEHDGEAIVEFFSGVFLIFCQLRSCMSCTCIYVGLRREDDDMRVCQ